MTLTVPFSEFASTVKRVLGVSDVYFTQSGKGWSVTAGQPVRQAVVVTQVDLEVDGLRKTLSDAGLHLHEGRWGEAASSDSVRSDELYFAAISYVSSEGKPGIWLDAFHYLPTPKQALLAMYDEFRNQSEVSEAGFDDFVRLSNANVVIESENRLRHFADQKSNPLPVERTG